MVTEFKQDAMVSTSLILVNICLYKLRLNFSRTIRKMTVFKDKRYRH